MVYSSVDADSNPVDADSNSVDDDSNSVEGHNHFLTSVVYIRERQDFLHSYT